MTTTISVLTFLGCFNNAINRNHLETVEIAKKGNAAFEMAQLITVKLILNSIIVTLLS